MTIGATYQRIAQLLESDTIRPPNKLYVRFKDGTYALVTAIEVIGEIPHDKIVSKVTLAVGEGR